MHDIKAYIEENLAKGHNMEDIRRHLIKYGHSPQKVDKAFHLILPQLPTMRLMGETFILILCLSGFAFLFLTFYTPFESFPFLQSSTYTVDQAMLEATKAAEFSLSAATVRIASTPLDADRKFANNFLNCKKSSHSSILANTYAYEYQILGSKDGLCEVKSEFVVHPDSSWENVEMVCLYDNTLPLQEALSQMDRCAGPLYDMMLGGL